MLRCKNRLALLQCDGYLFIGNKTRNLIFACEVCTVVLGLTRERNQTLVCLFKVESCTWPYTLPVCTKSKSCYGEHLNVEFSGLVLIDAVRYEMFYRTR